MLMGRSRPGAEAGAGRGVVCLARPPGGEVCVGRTAADAAFCCGAGRRFCTRTRALGGRRGGRAEVALRRWLHSTGVW